MMTVGLLIEPLARATLPGPEASINFHESTILSIVQHGGTIELRFDDVRVHDRTLPLTLAIHGIAKLRRDGIDIGAIGMEAPDGEVLTFDREEDRLLLIVEWNDFANKSRFTRSYEFIPGSAGINVQRMS